MTEADLPDIATLEIGGSRGATGWIEWNLNNYADHGFGLWIIETHSGEFVGDCGLTMQEVEGEWLVEAGWHVRSSLRRQGYAAEAAAAVREAAGDAGIDHLIAIIRPDNVASQGVAAKIGLALEREIHKNGGPALVLGADLTLHHKSGPERDPLAVGARSHDQYALREATDADAEQMAVVEALARQILAQDGIDLDALTAPQGFQETTSSTLALVAEADGTVVGMVRSSDLGNGVLALDQVSVHPEHARSGVGRRLLEATAAHARALGYHSITGTTFRDVPFNAPFYTHLNACEDPAPHPAMVRRRFVEQELGLDDFGPRIVMHVRL